MSKYDVNCTDTVFEADVKLKMNAKSENYERFASFLADYTNGKNACLVIGETFGPK